MRAGFLLVLILMAGCARLTPDNGVKNETDDIVDRPGQDQALVIQLAANGCVEEVLPPTDDNCRDPGESVRAGCGSAVDCACAARGKTISWQVTLPPAAVPAEGMPPTLPDFSIHFTGDTTPFRRGCTLTAAAGGVISCVIDRSARGDYQYDVKVSSCMEDYDPRIVIRNFSAEL